MKKIVLLVITVIGFNVCSWSQPDYSKIIFKSKITEYKKKKPNLQKLAITKNDITQIVTLLGSSFYSEEEINGISEKIWLSFIDPKKFDFVFKDIAIRTNTHWKKKNARGKIIVEPNPFLTEWTLANGEQPYVQKACNLILIYYKLMGYSEDAKSTKKSLQKMLHTKKYKFRPVYASDWTNSYLNAVNNVLKNKGKVSLIAANGQYEFFICDIDKKELLKALFKKMNWEFNTP